MSLGAICSLAFGCVFVLLAFLAVVMNVITAAFPERAQVIDEAVAAAISTTVASVWAGARVTRIEEER
jgi:hypothetical protein